MRKKRWTNAESHLGGKKGTRPFAGKEKRDSSNYRKRGGIKDNAKRLEAQARPWVQRVLETGLAGGKGWA